MISSFKIKKLMYFYCVLIEFFFKINQVIINLSFQSNYIKLIYLFLLILAQFRSVVTSIINQPSSSDWVLEPRQKQILCFFKIFLMIKKKEIRMESWPRSRSVGITISCMRSPTFFLGPYIAILIDQVRRRSTPIAFLGQTLLQVTS
jgi:hypothetical protein